MLEAGIRGEALEIATKERMASTMGSGSLDVYATPAMVALMEKAAYTSVASALEQGQGTVGTRMDVAHISASPMGIQIRATSELLEVDGRKLTFRVEAFDEAGKIGEGIHQRFIIEEERFLQKTNVKLERS